MKITLKREKGTGIVKKDGAEVTGQIAGTLAVAGKSISTAMESISDVASHYQIWHKKGEGPHCTSDRHVDLTQGRLIDLRDSLKVARRNIEQCESLVSTMIYLSGVTIIEEDEPNLETIKESSKGEENE